MSVGFLHGVGISGFEEVGKYMPFGRLALPKDIGNLCILPASEEGSQISLQVVAVDAALDRQSMREHAARRRQGGTT